MVYSPSPNINSTRRELQPLPDYMRWLKTSELHYLPYEETAVLEQGLWDEMPGIFLPTCILDLCYSLAEDPPPDVMNLVALLAWITVPQTKEYYGIVKRRREETIKSDEERERWKNHNLFTELSLGCWSSGHRNLSMHQVSPSTVFFFICYMHIHAPFIMYCLRLFVVVFQDVY